MPFRKEYTPEETAAYNERKKKEIEEIIDRIDNGVKAVFGSDKYKEYLKFVSKFTDYSANNTMLIGMQRPDATLVASFGKWKQLGRSVDKGEKGIEILAPVKYKTNQVLEIERPVVDEFGNPVYNEDGTAKTETVEDPMTGLAFKKAYVFDVSQTSGKEIPEPVSELSGDIDAAKKEAIFAALKKVTGVDIHFKDIQSGAKGYYSAVNNEIVIRSGMSDTQTLKTAFHEAAHDLIHDPNKKIVTVKSPRNEKEVQAESVAFIVAEKLGIDTSEYSFPYIASWSDGKQLEQLKNALKEIQEASRQISSAIESELLKLKKRGLSMEEKLYDDDLDNVQKAEFLIEDCSDRNINFSADDTKKILDFAEKHEDILETVKFVSDMEEIQRQRDSYGYDFTYMTPVDTKEAALEAFDNGEAVYLLYPDNTEGQALERSEIENFDGYFGIEKENTSRTVDDKLILVSKDVALEMWDVDLDVYIDGKRVSDRSEIINAPDNKKIYLSEYQYAAQLEFEDPKITNTVPVSEKNIIGNTPYRELGDKSELQYYKNLKNRHAENIAAQLNADGIRFSGLKKEWTTTITINKTDIPAYEAAVEKVKAEYDKAKNTEKDNYKKTVRENISSVNAAEEIDKAILENNYELYRYDMKKAVDTVTEKCGIERISKTLADYINNHGYDGRISQQNKEWAKGFEPPTKPYRPVFKTHPAVLNGFIDSVRDKIRSLEIQPLPSIYDDKFLYSTERVELRDDYRGIPETHHFNSSANEYFVEGIGWLDNSAYDYEQKMSGLSAKDFYAKVTQINADYIDISGKVGQIDLSRSDYDLLNEKTYSPQNAEKFEAAKAALRERKNAVGITEKPVEYYAVRQTNDHKFAVCTISADGLVTQVKPNIPTAAEAKKAMLELFEKKKNSVRCEFVHPQILDEKSAGSYKNMSHGLPDTTYRIQVNTRKNDVSDNTHFLQEYIKNPDDTYKVGKVVCKGDFEKCNAALADILKNGMPHLPEKCDESFEIYQLKNGEENRGIRFVSLTELAEQGKRPDFSKYEKTYESDISKMSIRGETVGSKLEAIFVKFNLDRPDDFKGRSLSVSDVVVMNNKAYYVDPKGFQPLKEFKPEEKKISQEKNFVKNKNDSPKKPKI